MSSHITVFRKQNLPPPDCVHRLLARYLGLHLVALNLTSITTSLSGSPQPASIKLPTMLFFSFFKTLIDHEVTVELKNDIQIRGILKSVDQYLNIKLEEISVVEELKYPHLSSVKNVFIRGSVVRYVHLPAGSVDVPLLEDATRREAAAQAAKAK
ncbi:Putative U6 snRNA-associated Sm-like protein LSm2 [Colletotrichum destructivum]|uniref:U6 snRNA-associated Sm-like protein LSm2 n=1 Tax=Colletotrichum destructivum TaxID=34406 RepID=A0AAX4I3Q6_9PEZI|nr:Putative U6 snRNA-associated Sm-like protein LSm2 [Colletotrichum destructivum]